MPLKIAEDPVKAIRKREADKGQDRVELGALDSLVVDLLIRRV